MNKRLADYSSRRRRFQSIQDYGYQSDQTSLVLGILGLVLCGLLSPFAIAYGRPGSAGRILGIVGTVLLIFGLFIGVMLAATGRI